MNRKPRRSLLFALLMVLCVAASPQSDAEDLTELAGDWAGTLVVKGNEIPLVLRLKESGGGVQATLDSPAQNAFGLPVSEPGVDRGTFSFEVPSVAGSYRGAVRPDGSAIEGQWKQGALSLPLTFRRFESRRAAEARRPQEPQPPFPYRSEEMSFPSAAAGVRLAGTLTLPSGEGAHPAILLVSGSGPQDRDSSLYDHKPFLVIADHFTRRGYAVLRFVDRGVAGSSGVFHEATTFEFAQDVIGASLALRDHPRVDPRRLTLLGHSEGGVAATLALNRGAAAQRLVLISAPALPYHAFVIDQVRALSAVTGDTPEVTRQKVQVQQQVIDAALAAGEAPGDIMAAVQRELTALGLPPEQARAQALPFGSPWLSSYLRLDPRPELKQITHPILAVWGDRDIQVDPKRNAETLRKAVGEGAAEIVILEGLNHLMQPAATGAIDEYAVIETTFAPEALVEIEAWLSAPAQD